MYWIKTDRGDLCNLALASDIRLERPFGRDTKFRVVAFFPGGSEQGMTWLASFNSETAAREYLDGITAGLLPACGLNILPLEPSFVTEDRNGKLHFDDAADAEWRNKQKQS